MKRQIHVVLGVVVAGSIRLAAAQPAPTQSPPASKVDARSLMQSGVKLLEAKDYLGALAVFKDAYRRFPSAKILLNIGTTQLLLDRKADAANSYQKYLDSGDADPVKGAEVTKQLVELDKAVAVLTIAVSPVDAEVQINGQDWTSAQTVKKWRVQAGPFAVRAKKQGFEPDNISGTASVGGSTPVTIALRVVPPPEVPVTPVGPESPAVSSISTAHVDESARSRFGALVRAHVSVTPRLGSAIFVGGTADATPQLSAEAAVILGPGIVSSGGDASLAPPTFGLFAGANYAFTTGKTRPRASLGLPVFFDSGPRLFIRAGGGVEYIASKQISLAVELGGEFDVNARMDIRRFALVPAIGVTGRL